MNGPLVLVIEDSATTGAIIRNFLESARATVILAENAEQGTALAIQRHPDVIVLEVVLPDADGVQLCRDWREDARLKDTPVLLISGQRVRDEDRAAGLRSGAMGYLVKPFSSGELAAQVNLLHQLGLSHRKLRQRNRQLEESNRELEQFAYVVSHDLKEPLRTVSCYCQLLEQRLKGELDSESREFLQFAVDGAGRMKQFIDDLLLYSRVGKADMSFGPVDLAEVVRLVTENLDAAVRQSGATIEVGELPHVRGCPMMLAQLFQNLIDNALKFRGQAPPAIRVYSRPEGAKCRISVADNGIGIDPRYFERIFDVFQRLHTRQEHPGTGIGLAVCKKIVERHGGRIWVASESGCRTEFHVEMTPAPRPLERHPPAAASPPIAPPHHRPTRSIAGQSSPQC